MNVLTEKMATGNCYRIELEFLFAETDIECSELNEGEFQLDWCWALVCG